LREEAFKARTVTEWEHAPSVAAAAGRMSRVGWWTCGCTTTTPTAPSPTRWCIEHTVPPAAGKRNDQRGALGFARNTVPCAASGWPHIARPVATARMRAACRHGDV